MKFILYSVKAYKRANSDFINKEDIHKVFTDANTMAEHIETNDECYHMRIKKGNQYTYFSDVDGLKIGLNEYLDNLMLFLKEFYNVDINENDIYYTKNKSKAGSFHISIPKINASCSKLREIHENFKKKNENITTYKDEEGKKKNIVDVSIYSDHWFRYPNQSKENNKETIHYIERGNMLDFIPEYIHPDSININDNICKMIDKKKDKEKKKIQHCDIDEATKILKNINYEKLNDREQWLVFGTALKKAGFTYGTFCEYSSKSNNHEPCTCEYVFESLDINTVGDPFKVLSTFSKKKKSKNIVFNSNNYLDDIDTINYMTISYLIDECFESSRFNNEDKYFEIIANIIKFHFCEKGFDLFLYFTSKSGFNVNSDEKLKSFYENLEISTKHNIMTLFKYAFEDNATNFKKVMLEHSIFRTIDTTSTDFARHIRTLNGPSFLWKNDNLYCYNGKTWVKNDLLLRIYIGNDFVESMKWLYMNLHFNEDFEKNKEQANHLLKCIMRLKTEVAKKELLKTTRETLTNDIIEFDDKPYLLCFNNKVYDLEKKEFRNHKYEDYTINTTGYDWIEPTQEQIKTVEDLIKSIMPNDAERQLLMQIFATGLEGVCLEKFIVQNGGGGNGKGLLNDLYLLGLGSYGMIGNNDILTSKQKTGANPEMAKLDKKRFVVFREVPERMKFENSSVKELTGGGNFSARECHSNDIEKQLLLTMCVEVNKKPKFKEEATQGDIRRLIDLYYPSTFTDVLEDVDQENHIYLAKGLYKEKHWQETHKFALLKIIILAHSYLSKEHKLTIPKSVELRNKTYLEGSSDILGWFYDVYEKTDNKEDVLKLENIFEDIKCSDYYNNLTKEERRASNRKSFYEKISENVFLRKYYFKEISINKIKYKNILTNHKILKNDIKDECLL